jgi:citrate synthase
MSSGLEGIVAAETILSHADPAQGGVWVRGRPIADLVAHYGYEGTVALLWEGLTADALTSETVREELGAGRVLAFSRLNEWLPLASQRSIGEAVRICLASLPDESSPSAIAGTLPVAIAALLRVRADQTAMAPDPSLGTAADFLRMALGTAVAERSASALDSYLTTVIDNGLGTSTFAARVIISTRASLVSAVTGAYGAFTGALHGGAPGLVLDMLDEIAASGDTDGWLERKLAASERLVGFGHRMFRIRDPRADLLRGALQRLDPGSKRLAFAQDVERRALAVLRRHKPGRALEANIEIDAALLLEAIGLPRDAFTPVFAISRVVSWIAHALEQQRSGRMIRPASTYVGPAPA